MPIPILRILCLSFLLTLTARAQFDSVVVFHEIHYHPVADGVGEEFVELYNQNSVDIDLNGWSIEGAGNFTFPEGTTIKGRSFLVVAQDPTKITAPEGVPVLGPLPGQLANGGEQLTLRNHNDRIIDQMDFDDRAPWPMGADGSGATLAKRLPQQSSRQADRWRASRTLGGTPGAFNDTESASSSAVQFSEAVALTDDTAFWFELHNPGSEPLSLQGLLVQDAMGTQTPLPEVSLAPSAYVQITAESLSLTAMQGDRAVLDRFSQPTAAR